MWYYFRACCLLWLNLSAVIVATVRCGLGGAMAVVSLVLFPRVRYVNVAGLCAYGPPRLGELLLSGAHPNFGTIVTSMQPAGTYVVQCSSSHDVADALVYVSTVNYGNLQFYRGTYTEPCTMAAHPELVPVLVSLIGQPCSRWRSMSLPVFDCRVFASWLSLFVRVAYATAGAFGGSSCVDVYMRDLHLSGRWHLFKFADIAKPLDWAASKGLPGYIGFPHEFTEPSPFDGDAPYSFPRCSLPISD